MTASDPQRQDVTLCCSTRSEGLGMGVLLPL